MRYVKKFLFIILIILLFLVAIGMIAYFGHKLHNTLKTYKIGEDTYSNSAQSFVREHITQHEPKPTPTPAMSTVRPSAAGPTAAQAETTSNPEMETSPVSVDFEKLWEINEEVCGWIYAPWINVNYPVAQTNDNYYYVRYMYDHRENSAGCIFVDYRNHNDFSDLNTIVYGHSMGNHTMFNDFQRYYNEPELFYEHPSIYYSTPDKDYRMDILACVIVHGASDSYTIFCGTDELGEYLQRMKEIDILQNNFDVDAIDRIVTFSSCAHVFAGSRYVVICHPVELPRRGD